MKIKIRAFKLVEIFKYFHSIFEEKRMSEFNKKVVDGNNNMNIFKEDFDFSMLELLRNENKMNIIGDIDKNSDHYYLSKQFVSKLDICNRKVKFFEIYNAFLTLMNIWLKHNIADNNITNEFLIFESKQQFEGFILKILGNELLLKERIFLKFLKLLWIELKRNYLILLEEDFSAEFFSCDLEETFNLWFYDIGKRHFDEEDFELHKAVFENNLRMIRKICACEMYYFK
jgi:hypothetical protein